MPSAGQKRSRDGEKNARELSHVDQSAAGPSVTAAQKRAKRRVPETERRRSEASCDRCKVRKIRCLRSGGDDGDEGGSGCQACTEAGAACEVTLPRKQRLYASMDQLSARYRVLDAILRHEFPDHDLDSLAGVLQLAMDRNVEVPKDAEGEVLALDPSRVESLNGAENVQIEPVDTSDVGRSGRSGGPDMPSTSPLNEPGIYGRLQSFHIDLPTKGLLPSELRPYQSSHAIPLPLPPSSDQLSGIFRIPEGSLVPAPRGGFHYVGPGSLAYFAKIARELVTRCNLAMLPTFDEQGLRRFLKAAEFTTFKTSQAIEARIEGHPATAAVDEDEETTAGAGNFADSTGDNDRTRYGGAPTTSQPSYGLGFATGLSPAATSPRSTLKHQRMLEVIPDRALSDRLVRAFFDRVHPNFTTFHQGAFQMRYESIWATYRSSGSTAEQEPGWVCALFMIYVLGAQALENELPDVSGPLQQRFLALFIRDGLPRLALTASLGNVQALMLMSLYQHNAGERNAAWMLLGQAARTAVALGMHRDGQNGTFDPFERNTRRMVWWTLHMFEQNLSFALGRPGNTDLIDVSAVLPDDVFLDGTDHPPGYFERAVALTEISSRVRRFVGSITTDYQRPEILEASCDTAKHISQQLHHWRADLPVHLSAQYQFATPRHRRVVTLLHVQCDHYLSIIGRPYLLCRVHRDIERAVNEATTQSSSNRPDGGEMDNRWQLPATITGLAELSVQSARSVVITLLALAERSLLEGSVWLDFYYVHHAAFVFGVHFLGKPLDEASAVDQEQRRAVSALLAVTKDMRLAPTYRILMNVAMQLAYIVGIGPDDQTQPNQGEPSLDIDNWQSMPPPPIPPTAKPGQWRNPQPIPSASLDSVLDGQGNSRNAVAPNVDLRIPQGLAHNRSDRYVFPNTAEPVYGQNAPFNINYPAYNPSSNQQSFEGSFANSTNGGQSLGGTGFEAPLPHASALEHLFGPLPAASRHNSPPDVFSDLYSFGLDTTAESPWDFFNIGVTAEGLLSGLRGLDGFQENGSGGGRFNTE